jgi:hypothetical protein
MSIYYDPLKNAYVDPENGAIIPIMDGDSVPKYSDADGDHQAANDYQLAQQLADENYVTSYRDNDFKSFEAYNFQEAIAEPVSPEKTSIFAKLGGFFPQSLTNSANKSTQNRHEAVPEGYLDPNSIGSGDYGQDAYRNDDWFLARAIQAMEFEISNEAIRQSDLDRGDFYEKEYIASACLRQALTLSTVIVLAQVIVSKKYLDH